MTRPSAMSAKFCFLGDDVTAEASTAMAARGAREALGTAEKPKKELATEGQDFDHDAYYDRCHAVAAADNFFGYIHVSTVTVCCSSA